MDEQDELTEEERRDLRELEETIAALIERKNALPDRSAERALIVRELTGLRYSREEAGGIIEDLDPMEWGGSCRPLPHTKPADPQVLPFRRGGSRRDQNRARRR